MINKAINHLVTTSGDSFKNLKKLGSTALATTLVATSVFTGVTTTAVQADNVTVTTTGDITLANTTDLIASANSKLQIQGSSGVVASLALSIGASGNTIIELGDITSGTEASTLAVVTSAGAITIAPTISALNAQIVAKISVNDNVATAVGDLATFTGVIGAATINIIDAISIGAADITGGNARFTASVTATAITVNGGGLGEDSIGDFAGALVSAVTMDDRSNKGSAKVILSGSTRVIAGTVLGAQAGDGTLQITGTGLTLNGRVGATGNS